MSTWLDAELAGELEHLSSRHRRRSCPAHAGATRSSTVVGGDRLLSFASNDYLGLASHPALAGAAALAARRSGFGAGASRLVSGDLPEHRALEADLAAFLAVPAALVFPTGYQTNLAVLSALAGPDDLVASDALNHASLIDGCRLSRARVVVYPHAQPDAALAALRTPGTYRRRWLVTESLFSMDGDVAPLAALAEAARQAQAGLIVDEAHAIGALGPRGRGLAVAQGVNPDVRVGTLGKAFGSLGGFVAGSATLREYLVNKARTFLFTTASPPPVAAAARAALHIINSPTGDQLRARLASNVMLLRDALQLADAHGIPSPILPVVLGSDAAAVAAAATLRESGFFVQPIRPPTVPEGTARLRVTMSAAHEAADVRSFADTLRHILRADLNRPAPSYES